MKPGLTFCALTEKVIDEFRQELDVRKDDNLGVILMVSSIPRDMGERSCEE